LKALAKIDPRKARVIELWFFGGLSVEETAEVLKLSADTVLRDWRVARAWLLGLEPKAHAQPQCSNASLRGGYGFHAFATDVPAGTPRAVIAVYKFDGRSSWTAALTVNINGSVLQSPDAGTYLVNPDLQPHSSQPRVEASRPWS
jgi:hypothetical protein